MVSNKARVSRSSYKIDWDKNARVTIGSDAADSLKTAIQNYIEWQEARFKPSDIRSYHQSGSLDGIIMEIETNNSDYVTFDIDTYEESKEIIRAIDFVFGEDYEVLMPLQDELRNNKRLLNTWNQDDSRNSSNNIKTRIKDGCKRLLNR